MTAEVVLAVDVGGTKTLMGLVDARGTVLAEHRIATVQAGSPLDDLGRVRQAVLDFVPESARFGRLVGAAAGFPEYVDPDGRLLSHEVLTWSEQPDRVLTAALAEAGFAGLSMRVDSDARLGARGEAWIGAGRGLGSFLYVSLGTGLSSTLVLGSAPWPGAHGMAIGLGEWPAPLIAGEVPVRNLERFASGAGIAERYLALTGEAATTRELSKRLDPVALAVLSSAGAALGSALGTLERVLDPGAFVVGGGLGSAAGPLHDALASAHRDAGGTAPIITAALGHRSGLLGAAALAWPAS